MRNLKKKNLKGFTLVELIVVMAIIGVLAAVLVPSMLGFMRDARVSSGNQAAHTVYTSANSWLTKQIAANDNAACYKDSNWKVTAVGTGATTPVELTGASTTTKSGLPAPATKTSDFRQYLGEKFSGSVAFVVNSSGDQVSFALYCKDYSGKALATFDKAITDKKALTPTIQDGFAATADIVGCSPLGDNAAVVAP